MKTFPIFSLIGLSLATDYKEVVAFGDSITDNGNVYKLTYGKFPEGKEYYMGRYSNGPTWVEYFADMLRANLTNLAYGGATTDRATFPKSHVPGCVQQAEAFAKTQKKPSNSTLATVVFQGNDFLDLKATAQTYMDNMDTCLQKILELGFTNVMVGTSNAPELTPAFSTTPQAIRDSYVKNSAKLPELWKASFQSLKSEFPNLKLHSLNLKGFYHAVADGVFPLSGELLPVSKEPCFEFGVRCETPENYMFWDRVHPTTSMHWAISKYAINLLPA